MEETHLEVLLQSWVSRVNMAFGTSSWLAALVKLPASTIRTKAFIASMRSMMTPVDGESGHPDAMAGLLR